LNERNVHGHSLPGVKSDDDAMDVEEQVVVWFLKSLGDGVEFSFV